MKTCSGCKLEKSKVEFHKNKTRTDGYSNRCKICARKANQKYYKGNLKKHRLVTRSRNAEYIRRNRERIELIKRKNPCACGESDPCCLDFHHIKGKDIEVSVLSAGGYRWERIAEEIEKCIVICANCHRKLHARLVK